MGNHAIKHDLLPQLHSSGLVAKVYNIKFGCPTLTDDITLTPISARNMQQLLIIAKKYARTLGFEFNTEKRVSVTFRINPKQRSDDSSQFNDE